MKILILALALFSSSLLDDLLRLFQPPPPPKPPIIKPNDPYLHLEFPAIPLELLLHKLGDPLYRDDNNHGCAKAIYDTIAKQCVFSLQLITTNSQPISCESYGTTTTTQSEKLGLVYQVMLCQFDPR